ncbi:hypothetical protein MJT46_007550 [Ovis ammon polii x Ovis aries]|nr:hypothetical protein MJT46_007550 [Ovis ammon polii x Ovis aries]
MIWFQVSQFPNQLTPAASLKHQPTNTLRAVNLPSFDCTLAYTCHLAFFLSGGPEHSTCKADVKWTGKAPVCKSKGMREACETVTKTPGLCTRTVTDLNQIRVPQGYYLFLRRHFSPFPLVTGLLGEIKPLPPAVEAWSLNHRNRKSLTMHSFLSMYGYILLLAVPCPCCYVGFLSLKRVEAAL